MKNNLSPIKFSVEQIEKIIPIVRKFLNDELGDVYTHEEIRRAIRKSFERRLDRMAETLEEVYTARHNSFFQELCQILKEQPKIPAIPPVSIESVQRAFEFGEESVFYGHRSFSKDRFSLMIEYLTSKGHEIYLTKLNKLLFYADLTHFYLTNTGISGTAYIHRRFGPVSDAARITISDLTFIGRLHLEGEIDEPPKITSSDNGKKSSRMLSPKELQTLDWVLDNYGHMTSREITDFSHKEEAYKNTDANKRIAYKYANLLRKLPPKDLLD